MDELRKAQSLLSEAEELAKTNPELNKVCLKLSRKIKADASFLEKHKQVRSNNDVCVASSNLPYLAGVLKVVKESDNVQEVICDFRKYGITVDVVCDSGKTWKKVVARNPQSLHLIWAGKGQYGTKDVVKKAEKYISSAKHFCDFSPPKIVCVFCNGVTYDMAATLESKGIGVEGERVSVTQEVLSRLHAISIDNSDDSDDDDLFEQARKQNNTESYSTDFGTSAEADGDVCSKIKRMATKDKVFLDITTMLVYISDVCNGGNFFDFKEKVLAVQAAQEKERSALEKIVPHLSNKKLITCQSALDDFTDIVKMLGGPGENKRAEQLVLRITVVPDCISDKFKNLSESGQIRERSKLIFGTADMLRCDILTSNEGFVRAAAGQGVHISAILHEPRALSERKRIYMTQGENSLN